MSCFVPSLILLLTCPKLLPLSLSVSNGEPRLCVSKATATSAQYAFNHTLSLLSLQCADIVEIIQLNSLQKVEKYCWNANWWLGAKHDWTKTLWYKKTQLLWKKRGKTLNAKFERKYIQSIKAWPDCLQETQHQMDHRQYLHRGAQDQHQFANELRQVGKRKWGRRKPHTHTYKSCLMVQIEVFTSTVLNGWGCVSTRWRLVNECKHYHTVHWAFPAARC